MPPPPTFPFARSLLLAFLAVKRKGMKGKKRRNISQGQQTHIRLRALRARGVVKEALTRFAQAGGWARRERRWVETLLSEGLAPKPVVINL